MNTNEIKYISLLRRLKTLSSDINYYNLDTEMDNFEEWLYTEKQIELREDIDKHIEELLEDGTIYDTEHIYLTIRESERVIEELDKIINNKLNK